MARSFRVRRIGGSYCAVPATTSTASARASRTSSRRRERRRCGGPSPRRPTRPAAPAASARATTRSTSRERERRDGAGLKAGRRLDLLGRRRPRALRRRPRARPCPRRPPVAGYERDDRSAVRDEDERLDDLRLLAPRCPRRHRRRFSSPPRTPPDGPPRPSGAGTRRLARRSGKAACHCSQRTRGAAVGSAADGGSLIRGTMKRASSNPSPRMRSTSSGGAGRRCESAISA